MDNNHKMTPEEEAKARALFDAEMNKEFSLVFTKKELTVIFNILTSVNAKYGDFLAIKPIVDKVEPIVAVASNIPPKDDPILTGIKNKSN